jgi:hypothetical protein
MVKHYPPAYYKYRKTHTTISISVSKEFKEQLDKHRGSLSYASFVKKLTENFNSEVSRRVNAVKEEIEDNVRYNEDNFKILCNICNKPAHISSRNPAWPKAQKILYRAFKTWRHLPCEEEEREAKKKLEASGK